MTPVPFNWLPLIGSTYLYGTHSAIGGAPWDSSESPSGHNEENDIRVAIASDQFVRSIAISVGVPIQKKGESDYGYAPHGKDPRGFPVGNTGWYSNTPEIPVSPPTTNPLGW